MSRDGPGGRGDGDRSTLSRAEDSTLGSRAGVGEPGRSGNPSAWSLAAEGQGASAADPARLRGRGELQGRTNPTSADPNTVSIPLPSGGLMALRPGGRTLPLVSFYRGLSSERQIASELTGGFILRAATRVAPALAASLGRPPPRPLSGLRSTGAFPVLLTADPNAGTDKVILGEALAQYYRSAR